MHASAQARPPLMNERKHSWGRDSQHCRVHRSNNWWNKVNAGHSLWKLLFIKMIYGAFYASIQPASHTFIGGDPSVAHCLQLGLGMYATLNDISVIGLGYLIHICSSLTQSHGSNYCIVIGTTIWSTTSNRPNLECVKHRGLSLSDNAVGHITSYLFIFLINTTNCDDLFQWLDTTWTVLKLDITWAVCVFQQHAPESDKETDTGS